VRRYIHDLITNADPSGMVAENTLLRDQTRQLDAMIGRLKAQPVVDEGYVLVSRAAVTEVLRISDRQHPAWEEVRTALLSAGKGGQ